ncbi:uncharacterized protein LOC129721168 [Wyeomyia smithii]|uniref:uncharacterized protein LOC129721168 n=1 Tax=Wyeomyia smithii TaxID=174621 RepID=UPI002467D37C|nr:uncharacterized protein LOC129721168 [Wyeomyia smithii]
MANKISLFLAVLFFTGFKILVFMEPPKDEICCSVKPNLRSVLFLGSVAMYLSRTKIFPVRYRQVPLAAQAVAEFFVFLLTIEIAMIAVWCRIETFLFRLMECVASSEKAMLYRDMGGDRLVQFIVTLCSLITFAFTAIGTGYVSMGSRVYDRTVEKVERLFARVRPQSAAVPICPVHLCQSTVLETDEEQRIPRRSPRSPQRRESFQMDSSFLNSRRSRRSSSRRRRLNSSR